MLASTSAKLSPWLNIGYFAELPTYHPSSSQQSNVNVEGLSFILGRVDTTAEQ